MAVLLARGQSFAKQILISRYEDRVDSGSNFIKQFITDRQSQERKIAEARFAGADIDSNNFDLAVESLGFEAAVLLNDKGELLAVYPSKPAIIGTQIASRYKHLSKAVAGESAISGVVPSAAKGVPVVALAIPFESERGRRVFSGAFSVEIGPLGAFLHDMLPYGGSRVFLVDDKSQIAASDRAPRRKVESLRTADGALFAASSSKVDSSVKRGAYAEGNSTRRYISRSVPGTDWHLIATVPENVLFETVPRSRWVQWGVYAALVIAAGLSMFLMNRLSGSRSLLQQQVAEQQRLNKALDDFSSRVAHDLRSPIAGVIMGIQLLDRPDLKPDLRVELAASVARQANAANDLVAELLDLAQASGTARRQQLRTADVLREVEADVQGVEISVGQIPEFINADPISFRQAILNLVRDAGKYGSTNGKAVVDINAETAPEGVVFSFADRGPGLPADQQAKIFEPFQRGAATDSGGTGLGLAIVGATAESHGGRAWYEDRDGGGAVFKLLLADG
ncbi:MAG: ATP-binding protein [Actinomycetota bacterium]|nr:hypothetical protein [Actinomycetota bacterium]